MVRGGGHRTGGDAAAKAAAGRHRYVPGCTVRALHLVPRLGFLLGYSVPEFRRFDVTRRYI